ncbi:L-selectin-like [Puntigrus tetrazona]|uniref:L-selectin-like n=1 Tax=Puntigrus tetrazona TaxID=1606681 RepID=UPI001C89E5E1|nr:L-selectin-like [Puntigrus tetrazona]
MHFLHNFVTALKHLNAIHASEYFFFIISETTRFIHALNSAFQSSVCARLVQSVSHAVFTGQAGVLQRYVLVTSALTWSEAQTFCRGKHTDLVSVRNLNENKLIQPLVPKDHLVYIGLYKDFYKWSDNSSSSFRRWSAGEPDSSGECVEQDLWDTNTWTDEDCSETKPFICQDGEPPSFCIASRAEKNEGRDCVQCIAAYWVLGCGRVFQKCRGGA